MTGLAARRPNLVAAVVTLLLSVTMVGPGLLPGRVLSSADIWWFSAPWAAERPADFERPANPDLEDAAQQFQPLREEVKRQLPDAPLWNPWIAGGRPLLADAQSAVFAPFTLPAYVLPLQSSLAWTAIGLLWAASFGMYLLARALGMRLGGSLLAGMVYGLNLWMVTHLSYPHSTAWALLPWLLWATDRLVRRPSAGTVSVLAVVVGFQFLGGHPESSFHVLLATLAFFALRLARAPGREGLRSMRPALVAMTGALVAGAGLAALMLVPFLELLLNSADLAERSGTGVDYHLRPELILGFFFPDYWGRSTQTPIVLLFFSRSWYLGALPLMLAAAALALRPRGERLWIAGTAGLLLAVIFGLPPFLQIATRLPLLSLGHNDRLIVVVLACVALLAGWGLDELSERTVTPRKRRLLLGAAAAITVLPLIWAAVRNEISGFSPRAALEVALALAEPPPLTDPDADDVIRLASVALWVGMAGAGLVLLLLRVRGLAGRTFTVLALALVALDLLRAGLGYNPAIPDERTEYPLTGSLRYLQDRRPARFVAVGDVPLNVPAIRFEIPDSRGYDLPIPKRYNRLWRQEVSPEYPDLTSTLISLFLQVPKLDERRLHTLRMLGVENVLVAPEVPEADLRGLGLTRVYTGPDARVYRLADPLPRTWVAGSQRPVEGGQAALEAVSDQSFDPADTAVTESRLPGVPDGAPGPAGTARITGYEPSRVEIDADLTKPGVVVLSDNWFPGWRATLDGEPVDIERVDYVHRGIPAGAGSHRIEMTYEPMSWRIGWTISLLTALALAAAVLMAKRRGARSTATGPRSQP